MVVIAFHTPLAFGFAQSPRIMNVVSRGTRFRVLQPGDDMTNYNVSAELYPGRNHKSGRVARYQRFPSLAEAVQYTMEQLPVSLQPSSLLEAEEIRYDGEAIRALYFSEDYPLRRAYVGNGHADKS